MKNIPRLKKEYVEKYRKELLKELKLQSVMAAPDLKKIVINMGLGAAIEDKSVIEIATEELRMISGQKPVVTLAKKAISGFKIKKGDAIGLKVTLRGVRMWEFMDKLISIAFPRTKDFRGLSPDAFDGSGNYTIGITDQTVFPEIDPNTVDKLRGMEITIVTNADNDKDASELLNKFGFPFTKSGEDE
ncbi:MAG: 50S ribosomal protein L5 [Patescibacteria group bacterium]|nr:50S ribosomal protein L5 [Patescibacteria group bacterium]